MEKEFNVQAGGKPDHQAQARDAQRKRDMPSAEAMLDKGITTRETLEYLRQRRPPVMEPSPSPEDPAGWRSAIASADAEHDKWVADLKAKFEARSDRANQAFKTAQQQSPHERSQTRERDEGMEP